MEEYTPIYEILFVLKDDGSPSIIIKKPSDESPLLYDTEEDLYWETEALTTAEGQDKINKLVLRISAAYGMHTIISFIKSLEGEVSTSTRPADINTVPPKGDN